MQWLREEFVPYLVEWHNEVENEPGLNKSGKAKMFLSQQSFVGLVMTGMLAEVASKLWPFRDLYLQKDVTGIVHISC